MELCTGDVRKRRVYTTSTNEVEIKLLDNIDLNPESPRFLIEFEGEIYRLCILIYDTLMLHNTQILSQIAKQHATEILG